MASRSDINNIFDKIDKLNVDDIRNLNDLLVKLKSILNELAYHSLVGGNSELEMWHSGVNDQIRQEVDTNTRQSNPSFNHR
jgi:hypothetical protein